MKNYCTVCWWVRKGPKYAEVINGWLFCGQAYAFRIKLPIGMSGLEFTTAIWKQLCPNYDNLQAPINVNAEER